MIGYARCTPFNHDLDDQRQRLAAAGCEIVFDDNAAGASADLPGLDAALSSIGTGDLLIVCSLDRPGRSVQHVIDTILDLNRRGVGFRSLREEIDLTGGAAAIPIRVLEDLNRIERHFELEQIYAGFEARLANQARPGRKHKLSEADVDHALQTVVAGQQTVAGMAKLLGVGRNTLSRALGRRPDYIRLSKAQAAEVERLADQISASADNMCRRLDETIKKIDRVTSPEYIAERDRVIKEELAVNPVEFDWDAVHEVLQKNEPWPAQADRPSQSK